MNKFQVLLANTPFRKYILQKIVSDHFTEFFWQLQNKTVLEIGCGNGAGARIIKTYFIPKKIIAIDLDERMINAARKNINNPSILFELGDASKLKYEDYSFDAIFDFGVIHHIPNWKDCLRELYRVLRPKGKIFIYDLSIESFDNFFLGRIQKILFKHPYDSIYRKPDFIGHIKKLGFKIIKQKSLNRHFIIIAEK